MRNYEQTALNKARLLGPSSDRRTPQTATGHYF